MPDDLRDTLKQKAEAAKKESDRRDDEFEQALDKTDPYVHEARTRLAEGSRKDRNERSNPNRSP